MLFGASAKAVEWVKDDDLTLLELAEANGISVDSGCRSGNCGTCEVALEEGEVGYLLEPAAKPQDGKVLLCCSQPLSSKVKIAF